MLTQAKSKFIMESCSDEFMTYSLRIRDLSWGPGEWLCGRRVAGRRDASVAAIQSRVTTLELGVEPCDPEGFEPELSECGAGSAKRKKPGAHIMQVAGQREFLRAERTARPALVRFQHQYSESTLCEYTRCHEPIWARTDHDNVRTHRVLGRSGVWPILNALCLSASSLARRSRRLPMSLTGGPRIRRRWGRGVSRFASTNVPEHVEDRRMDPPVARHQRG